MGTRRDFLRTSGLVLGCAGLHAGGLQLFAEDKLTAAEYTGANSLAARAARTKLP